MPPIEDCLPTLRATRATNRSGDVAVPAFRALLVGASDADRIARVDRGSAGAADRAHADLPSAVRAALDSPRASVADVLARLHTLR